MPSCETTVAPNIPGKAGWNNKKYYLVSVILLPTLEDT